MKTQMTKYICALSLLTAPTFSYADTGVETIGTESVKDSADNAESSNSQGQLMSMLTGAKLLGESAQHFSACPPHNPGQCALGALKAAMGLLSMMQGGKHGGSKAGANFTSGITNGTDGFTPGNTDPYEAQNSAAYNDAKNALAKLEKGVAGTKYDPKTGKLSTADGKTYDLSKLGTPEGMAAAGFSPGAISGAMEYGGAVSKSMQDKVEKMKLGALSAAGGVDEGGGSGGRGGGSGSSSESYAGGGGGAGGAREPTSMAGMQKNYNGEPIGVAADSIFNMMNRRYKVKENQGSFFSDADIALQK